MEAFLHWIDDNIVGIIIFFFLFGGSIIGGLQVIVSAYGGKKIRNLKGQLAAANQLIDEKDAQLTRTENLLEKVSSGRPIPELEMVEFAATSARMARLLGLVQGADTAWPQLADGLREQIDAELRAYHTVPVPKALEGPKARGKRKR